MVASSRPTNALYNPPTSGSAMLRLISNKVSASTSTTTSSTMLTMKLKITIKRQNVRPTAQRNLRITSPRECCLPLTIHQMRAYSQKDFPRVWGEHGENANLRHKMAYKRDT